ncbi:phosphohistidine phosphatase SixA [uncultured Ilyobacter sp.]|uniref:phosphohistidine phosphatase SixA n=1 Tax=uncultured Ilyobacter sp. TaxID=544433 RepID=UPI0029C72CB8|nr:phosphohistidine phosphatase SixA [uncultured Ilyobacter sp.]
MAIYLARHGDAVSAEKNLKRPLSLEGISEVEKMSLLLETMGLKVDKVIHSGKKRAEESAEIFSKKICDGKISKSKGLDPNDDIKDFWKKFESEDNIMYVGHLPFMERLASFILTGDENGALLKIKTGGVVCLERSDDRWHIKWMFSPDL